MTKSNKRSILLSFDEEMLLHLRKRLFPLGISVQEFFAQIIERAVFNNDEFNELLEDIKNNKLENLEKGEIYRLSEESLYDLFEEKLKNKENKEKEG